MQHRTLGQIDAIGVDEIQYAKGHKYLTLVYQIDIGITRLLWVGRERTIESFQGFFTTMGQEVISKISFICSDMWEPYLKVVQEKCSEALHILDRFHIVGKKDLYPSQLSGGQQQLVGVARAIIHEPSLLLADEPTGNLHSEQAAEIMALFRRLNGEGTTIVQVTHSADNASYGRRTLHMADGWLRD